MQEKKMDFMRKLRLTLAFALVFFLVLSVMPETIRVRDRIV